MMVPICVAVLENLFQATDETVPDVELLSAEVLHSTGDILTASSASK